MKNTSKLLLIFLLMFLVSFELVSCSKLYSAETIVSNLKNNGYTIEEEDSGMIKYEIKENGITYNMSLAVIGLTKFYLISKGSDNDKEFAYIIIFNSSDNANALNTSNLTKIGESAKNKCGSNKQNNNIVGIYENVIFAGYEDIKNIAQIKN